MYRHDVGALGEGRAIQRQPIWCAGLSCLSRSSNQINQKDQMDHIDEMNQVPATRREMGSSPFSPSDHVGMAKS
jgi:hypothetical protein